MKKKDDEATGPSGRIVTRSKESTLIAVMNRLRQGHALSAVVTATLLAVADRIGKTGGQCRASAKTLGATMGLSVDSVYRGLRTLEDLGVISRRLGGYNRPDEFTIRNLDAIPTKQPKVTRLRAQSFRRKVSAQTGQSPSEGPEVTRLTAQRVYADSLVGLGSQPSGSRLTAQLSSPEALQGSSQKEALQHTEGAEAHTLLRDSSFETPSSAKQAQEARANGNYNGAGMDVSSRGLISNNLVEKVQGFFRTQPNSHGVPNADSVRATLKDLTQEQVDAYPIVLRRAAGDSFCTNLDHLQARWNEYGKPHKNWKAKTAEEEEAENAELDQLFS